MSASTLSSLLRIAAILLAILGVATLIPHSNPMISDLGYHTFCPFAPWSTLTLLFLAWAAWMVRGYIGRPQV